MQATLSYKDLLGIGISAILGSGGFNLLGKAVVAGGAQYPLALGATSLLFLGASRVYDKAFQVHPSNTAESDIVTDEFGAVASRLSEGGILLFNILSVSTILVFSAKLMFPAATWNTQISFALLFLAVMYIISLHGIEENKQVTNISSAGLVIFLGLLATLGFGKGFSQGFSTGLGTAPNFPLSVLYFYFILAGFDVIIKFTNETRVKSDIPSSFYSANAISIVLVAGICIAFTHLAGARSNENNAIGEIVKSVIGGKYTIQIVMAASIAYMLVTTFICFLTSSRFFYGLGEKSKWSWLTDLNAVGAPNNAILLTFLVAVVGILINHVDTLVRLCGIVLTITLILVSAAVTKKEWSAGRTPWIEGGTLAGLIGLMGVILRSGE